jgi:outer membrane protein assembly factor BamB
MIRLDMVAPGVAVFLAITWSSTAAFSAEANWPKWRGPRGDGHAVDSDPPTRWDASSVVWKTPLKGRGQSSPVVWGDRVFLTTALDNGKQRVVFCVSTRDGKILWEQVAWTGQPEESHDMNGWASATCVTDGEVVIAFFGKGGLHGYTTSGKHLWSRDLGAFENPWGTAACPVIAGNLVIQNGDSDKGAFIEAFDRMTGETAWRKSRPDHRGWSTPFVWAHDGREDLVLNGHEGVTTYDPQKGEVLWTTKSNNGRGEPTVTPGAGLFFVVCGLAGDMYAVRPGKAAKEPEVIWSSPRKSGRDLPSPIVVGDYVLVAGINGVATCYEAQTGKEFWKDRLGEAMSSSPIAIDGLALFLNEAGETVVVEPGPKKKIVARNTIGPGPDEIFRASLAPVGKRVYVRSDRVLYCIQ